MTDYTPGQWDIRPPKLGHNSFQDHWHIEPPDTIANDGFKICDLYGPDAEANAQLIASAPRLKEEHAELVEALELAYAHMDPAMSPVSDVCKKIDAILEKVKQ